MRLMIAAMTLALTAGLAQAAPAAAASGASATLTKDSASPGSCETKAADKKLSGAAKNSYIKKCHKDSKAAAAALCTTAAADKKLAGAAKNSFIKKCEKDSAVTAAQ
ncbi:MAG: hypothetical protein EOP40_12865 [Rubrivivax sp.]|nr:MAG: hypothetical protein EOP40_12865 [Rubrivivax sp.]